MEALAITFTPITHDACRRFVVAHCGHQSSWVCSIDCHVSINFQPFLPDLISMTSNEMPATSGYITVSYTASTKFTVSDFHTVYCTRQIAVWSH